MDKPLHSEQINEISVALSKAQMEIQSAEKDSTNPHFRSNFASLNSHWSACKASLGKHNLMITQLVSMENDKNILVTILSHSSGQWFKSYYPLIPMKNDPQAMGSCLSYARRYMLSSIVGTTAADDDGEEAMGRKDERKPKEDKPKTIQKHQWTELNQLIDQCDSDFQQKMRDYLTSQGITSFAEMEEPMYHKLRKGCIANISTRQVEHAVS